MTKKVEKENKSAILRIDTSNFNNPEKIKKATELIDAWDSQSPRPDSQFLAVALDALYSSEPQVCPECEGSGKRYKYTSSTPEGMQSGKCPACNGTGNIPAPSTPASVPLPPELLDYHEKYAIAKSLDSQIPQDINSYLEKQILKCHQSEAHYEKKSHNQTIIIRECTKYIDDQKARIKELENRIIALQDYAVNLETSITNLTSRHSADIEQMESAIRADQNRKIGNYFNKHFPTRDQMFEAIVKLQKGEL